MSKLEANINIKDFEELKVSHDILCEMLQDKNINVGIRLKYIHEYNKKIEKENNMNKLLDVDFIIQKDNRTIVLDIKHMDEGLRKGNSNPIIKSDCGKYIVYSFDSPQIGRQELFLNGAKKEKDNEFTYYTFNSTEEMNEYIENMNKLIDEINNPTIEIDINKDNTYDCIDCNIQISRNYNENWIEIKVLKYSSCRQGIKFWYISENETKGQPFDEVVEEFDNFCKRRNINAKLVR